LQFRIYTVGAPQAIDMAVTAHTSGRRRFAGETAYLPAYVTESGYGYGEKWATARLLRINDDGSATVIAADDPAR